VRDDRNRITPFSYRAIQNSEMRRSGLAENRMNDQTENIEVAEEPSFLSDRTDRRRSSSRRVATGLLLAGLATVVVTAPCTVWRYTWERRQFVTTKGRYIRGNHMSLSSSFGWTDHHGVKHSKEFPLFSFGGKDFEVEYLRDRPSEGWIKTGYPSLMMTMLWTLDVAGLMLFGIGCYIHWSRRETRTWRRR
jgi:hypothetical protein